MINGVRSIISISMQVGVHPYTVQRESAEAEFDNWCKHAVTLP